MKCYNDFIVNIPQAQKETTTTNSGLILQHNPNFSTKETVNTVVKVYNIPFNYNGEISVGDTIFIDPTILMQMTYVKGGKEENRHLVNREKKLYKVPQNMVIAYKKKNSYTWVAYEENLLCERVIEQEETKEKVLASGIIIPQTAKKPKPKLNVHTTNNNLIKQGLKKGTSIISNAFTEIDVWFNNKKLVWLRQNDVLAIYI